MKLSGTGKMCKKKKQSDILVFFKCLVKMLGSRCSVEGGGGGVQHFISLSIPTLGHLTVDLLTSIKPVYTLNHYLK